MNARDLLTIGELARRTGISVSAIRFYEERGLVQSLQKVQVDEDEEVDDIGSLAKSAEALRLTAAAPARSAGVARDYDR